MKTKTTGIPFKDYGADTTAGTEVIKPQHAEYKRTRGPENPSLLLFANVNARLQIVYDVFQQFPAEKKAFRSPLRAGTSYLLSNYQIANRSRQKFSPGRCSREDPNRLVIFAIRKRSMHSSFLRPFDYMCEPRDLSDLLLTLCVWGRMRFREQVFTERDVKFTNISVQRFLLKTL